MLLQELIDPRPTDRKEILFIFNQINKVRSSFSLVSSAYPVVF